MRPDLPCDACMDALDVRATYSNDFGSLSWPLSTGIAVFWLLVDFKKVVDPPWLASALDMAPLIFLESI